MNLALIGYRSSGKTTVSKILQSLLKRKRIEIDREIEKAFLLSIEQIVEKKGWQTFRRMEKIMIEKYNRKNNCILDLGGGAILHHQSMLHIKMRTLIVFLNCPPEIIIKRLNKSYYRPALTNLSFEKEVEKVLAERMPFYQTYADLVVNSETNSPLQCANIISEELHRREKLLSFMTKQPHKRLGTDYSYA